MAITTYNCMLLNGGDERSIDSLSAGSLLTGDRVVLTLNGQASIYAYDANGTEAEQTATHPYIIRPDDYSTGGNWIEQITAAANSKKMVTTTHDLSIDNTTQDITGFGFSPNSAIIMAGLNDAHMVSWAIWDGIKGDGIFTLASTVSHPFGVSSADNSIMGIQVQAGYRARVTKIDPIEDGLRFTWGVKTGAPYGTPTIMILGMQ